MTTRPLGSRISAPERSSSAASNLTSILRFWAILSTGTGERTTPLSLRSSLTRFRIVCRVCRICLVSVRCDLLQPLVLLKGGLRPPLHPAVGCPGEQCRWFYTEYVGNFVQSM